MINELEKRLDLAHAKICKLKKENASLQAKIDVLMLEYCPDEMTQEQIEEWGRHQQAVHD